MFEEKKPNKSIAKAGNIRPDEKLPEKSKKSLSIKVEIQSRNLKKSLFLLSIGIYMTSNVGNHVYETFFSVYSCIK
jgi:hypothetical protein